MKYSYKIYLYTLSLTLITIGCDTDELHELNNDPQAVTEIDLNFLFSKAELSIANYNNIDFFSSAIQQITVMGHGTAGVKSGNFYDHNEGVASFTFNTFYADQLKNLAEVIYQTGEGGYAEGRYKNTREAARILRAWNYLQLTDIYGAIPYFEANKGIDGIFFPSYDIQSVIYPELLNELEEAVNEISTSNLDEGFKNADMIFNGDITKWKKWGNSLMLRYAMRVSNVAPDLAGNYVSKAIQGGVFESNADNVWIPMDTGPDQWANQNPISREINPEVHAYWKLWLSETLINFLKGADPNTVDDDDPRLMVLSGGIAIWRSGAWVPIDTDPLNQLGVPPGYYQYEVEAILNKPGMNPDSTFSWTNYLMLDLDDPYMLMNYAEVEFLQAEAIERSIGTGITGTAEEHYNAGVRAAMQMYTPFDPSLVVSDAAVDAYLAIYPYGGGGLTGSESRLEQIGWQMWVSKFFNWCEAWCDWKRTGYPPLVAHTSNVHPVTPGTIPVRLPYPILEVETNPNFNQSAHNNYISPVWWDEGIE